MTKREKIYIKKIHTLFIYLNMTRVVMASAATAVTATIPAVAAATNISTMTANKIENFYFINDSSTGTGYIPGSSSSSIVDVEIATIFPILNDSVYNHFRHNHKLSWDRICIIILFLLLIIVTVVGNTLVILSVITIRRLRTVTNCFVTNLAITDWLVGVFVMPPAVDLYIVGSWQFGWILCDIWISLDVLLCTASILSLCAISLDRYLAIIQPLAYSKKRRSKRLALLMVLVVWIVALAITCPPFLGWYEPGRLKSDVVKCRYNQNKGYVVFSGMGSFFIPLSVMLYVYLRIGIVLNSRRQRITLTEACEKTADATDQDIENFLTDNDNIQPHPKFSAFRNLRSKTFDELETVAQSTSLSLTSSPTTSLYQHHSHPNHNHHGSATLYELVDISRSSSTTHCSTNICKYAAKNPLLTSINASFHLSRSQTSSTFSSESCLSSTTTNTKLKKFPVPPVLDRQILSAAQQSSHQCQNNSSNGKIQQNHQNQQQHNQPRHHHTSNCYRVPPIRISTLKRETKTAKTLTIVMGGFIICWLPFFIYYILIPFLPSKLISESLMSFLTWVGWVNCAINPFIYAFYSADFRTAFWSLTFRRICRKQQPNHLNLFKG